MKITVEHYNRKYSIEVEDDLDANTLKDHFNRLLVLAGFSPSVIDFRDGGRYEYVGEDEEVTKKLN